MGPTTGTYKENTNRLNREQNVYRLLLLKIQSTPDFETPTFLDMQEKINNFNNLYGKVSEEDATHLKICSAIKYVQTIESNIKNGTELTSMDKKICNNSPVRPSVIAADKPKSSISSLDNFRLEIPSFLASCNINFRSWLDSVCKIALSINKYFKQN